MTMRTTTGLMAALAAALLGATPVLAQDEDKPFRSMAIEPETSGDAVYRGVGPFGNKTLCVIPEPPVSLTPTNGHEFAYMLWLDKLEMERRLATGQCECQVNLIGWDEVGEHALPWLADDSQTFPRKRRHMIEDLEALQLLVLAGCAG